LEDQDQVVTKCDRVKGEMMKRNSCRPELTRAVVLVWIAFLLSSVGAAEGGVLIREPQAITY